MKLMNPCCNGRERVTARSGQFARPPATLRQPTWCKNYKPMRENSLPRARLVVLSACETGLGESTHGEGAFSLQRAFHVAGAQTVVSSLWPVPDRATALLMARFYRNLWQDKMPRLAALREAQRWLRQEAARNSELLRGIEPLDDEETARNKRGQISPRIWAGFILSGDWR